MKLFKYVYISLPPYPLALTPYSLALTPGRGWGLGRGGERGARRGGGIHPSSEGEMVRFYVYRRINHRHPLSFLASVNFFNF